MSTPSHAPGRTEGRRRVRTAAAIVAVVAVIALAAVAGIRISRSGQDELAPGDTDTAVDVPETRLDLGACLESLEYVHDDLLRQVPCAVPHQAQVVATEEITDAEFDSRYAYARQAEEHCLPVSYQLVPDEVDTAALRMHTVSPTSGSWEEGDRMMRCLLTVEPDHHLTGSFTAGDVELHTEAM